MAWPEYEPGSVPTQATGTTEQYICLCESTSRYGDVRRYVSQLYYMNSWEDEDYGETLHGWYYQTDEGWERANYNIVGFIPYPNAGDIEHLIKGPW